MRYVEKWGVELEGAWDSEPTNPEFLKTDGSVTARGTFHAGELVSPVETCLVETRRFMVENYPDHVNESCGLHVHVSFGNRNVAAISVLLDSADFMQFLISGLKAWGKRGNVSNPQFWSRLEGGNRYCGATWAPGGVLRGSEDRYHAVNFASYHRHKTVEVRVLPMFKRAQTAYKAIRRVLALVDAFLTLRFAESMDVVETCEYRPEVQEADSPQILESVLLPD